jgi:hypothetical protein
LRGFAPHLPHAVAAVVNLALPASMRPIWPNLQELLVMTEGNLPPEAETFLRQLNHLWLQDRAPSEWWDDLVAFRRALEAAPDSERRVLDA